MIIWVIWYIHTTERIDTKKLDFTDQQMSFQSTTTVGNSPT